MKPEHIDVPGSPLTEAEVLVRIQAGGVAAVSESCRPINEILARVGDKWSVLIVTLLGGGPRRFNEIKRATGGISQRMLTLTLRGLERDGMVTRTVFPTIPPRVDYELTELGRSLRCPLAALSDWAFANRPLIEEARIKFDTAAAKAA